MAKQTLFSACKRVFRDGISGTYTVGNNNIFLELYSQDDIDQNNEIGNSSEENIVVVAGDTITIPEGYILTPVKPKKSLVVICNTFVNNGTVSMYQKAPNVLPHDLFIIEKNELGGSKDVIIPAYANNQVILPTISHDTPSSLSDRKGADGTNRNCGAGGFGAACWGTTSNITNGSGYAFGGGAGTGGINLQGGSQSVSESSVDSAYPMRGGNHYNATGTSYYFVTGGVGNPHGISQSSRGDGSTYVDTAFGCGGRVIIFCCNFTNNGIITVNGTDVLFPSEAPGSDKYYSDALGGASGAGAVDLFYTTSLVQGTITANGGQGGYCVPNNLSWYSGSGGNGSITLTAWSQSSVLKPIAKYMSKENMVYFLTNYIQRLKQGED